ADRFEVSVRTVERDISSLQQSGVPIWATPGPGGGYSVDPSMSLPPLNFSADEATAIAVALAASGPIPFGDAARSALRKLVAAMSAANQEGGDDDDDVGGSAHLLTERVEAHGATVAAAWRRSSSIERTASSRSRSTAPRRRTPSTARCGASSSRCSTKWPTRRATVCS